MSSNLPKNFSTQIIINNIASVLINNDITDENQNNYISIVESMIQLHNSVSSISGSNTKINKLEGIDWNTGEITDLEALIDTSDDQVDFVQSKAMNDMEKLIIQQQKYIRGQAPDRIRETHEVIMDEYQSIGYKAVDRAVRVKSDNQKSLASVSEIFMSNSTLEAYIDTRKNGQALEIYFPRSLTEDVLSELNSFNGFCEENDEHIMVEKVIATPPHIQGMKDIQDVERKMSLRKERQAELSI
jgi:hypothetical protein